MEKWKRLKGILVDIVLMGISAVIAGVVVCALCGIYFFEYGTKEINF